MQEIPFLDRQILGNPVVRWTYALGTALALLVVLRLLAGVGVRAFRAHALRTKNEVDDLAADLLERTKLGFIFLFAVWVGSHLLSLSPTVDSWIRIFLVLGLLLQAALWASAGVNFGIRRYEARQIESDPGGALAVGVLGFVARVAVWLVVLLVALDNLGIDVTALVTTMGIGGIAIALAVQNVLKDLFASLSIALDKPFVIGDFIVVGDLSGTVEEVGIKTTRVRSLTGEQLIFSNSDLLDSRIRNFRRMQERRISFSLGVIYGTPPSRLERIPELVQSAVESCENSRFDRCHLKSLGDFSLNYETVYYMEVPDHLAYMNTQQAINLELYRRFDEEGIEFAFPTQNPRPEAARRSGGPLLPTRPPPGTLRSGRIADTRSSVRACARRGRIHRAPSRGPRPDRGVQARRR
jgi:small-conductance mechanosensitive channel